VTEWTKEELDTLKETYPHITVNEMIEGKFIEGRSVEDIRYKIHKLIHDNEIKYKKEYNNDKRLKIKELIKQGKSYNEISKETGYSQNTIPMYRTKFGLPKRCERPEIAAINNDDELLSYLKENKSEEYGSLCSKFSNNSIRRLIDNRFLFSLQFYHRKCKGASLEYRSKPFFKEDYYGKMFICYDRTSMIRLASNAIVVFDDRSCKHGVAVFLHKNFSKAESYVIKKMLGIPLTKAWDNKPIEICEDVI
jgi:uncharacterized protein YerC